MTVPLPLEATAAVPPPAPLLLVCATALEAAPVIAATAAAHALELGWGTARQGTLQGRAVVVASLGVGKVNTAAGLAILLARLRPRAVLQFGIGGAFVGSFLSVGAVAAAAAEVHTDCGAGEGESWQGMRALGFPLLAGDPPLYNEIPLDPAWSRAVANAAGVPLLRFATSERVTATFDAADTLQERFDVAVESMEGAAAAQVCRALGVPLAELRAISNIVGERDKRAWDVPGAVHSAAEAVVAVVRAAGAAAGGTPPPPREGDPA